MALIQKRSKMNDFLVGKATGRRKPSLRDAITVPLSNTGSNIGTYLSPIGVRLVGGEKVYVYHAEKVRDKFVHEVELYKSGPKKGTVKKAAYTKVRAGGWTLRVFAIPKDRVKSVEQHARHFTLVLK